MNNDLISMEEAIRAVHDEFDECLNVDESGEYIAFWVEGVLKTLPCVIPERKKGKWIEPSREGHWTYDKKAYAECSICGSKTFLGWNMSFCPNCGAEMEKGEQDGKDT